MEKFLDTISICPNRLGQKAALFGLQNLNSFVDKEKNKIEKIKAILKEEKITVVADVVGGKIWRDLVDVLERGGRYVCSGAIAGPIVDLDLRTLYLRDLSFHGSTVLDPQVTIDLVKYIETGQIKPCLAATFKLYELREAQKTFMAKKHTGNIVVTT